MEGEYDENCKEMLGLFHPKINSYFVFFMHNI